MANAERIAGVDSFLLYAPETTFGTAVTPTTHFGLVTSFSPTKNNNLIKSRGMAGSVGGGRNVEKIVGGRYEATASVEFEPQAFDWLEYVLGGARTGAGTGASPYSYPEANTVTSLTLGHNIDNDTTDRNELFFGTLINSATIRSTTGEAVTCTLDLVMSGSSKTATLDSNSALNTGDPYTFAGGSIEIPDGSAISNIIDSVEITITNTAEILFGIGSRLGQGGVVKARDYQIRFTVKYLDEDLLDLLMGSATTVTDPTESATVALRFTNGANKYVDFVFTGVTFDSISDGVDLNEVITEDVTATARSLTVGEQQTA